MASSFVKVIMVIVCINLLLFTAGTRVIDDNDAFLNKFFNVTKYQDEGIVDAGGDAVGSVNTPLQRSGSGLLQFIDAIGAVSTFITFLINIVFTPLGLFMGAGIPATIGLLIGIPLLVLTIFGLAYFIRSGA